MDANRPVPREGVLIVNTHSRKGAASFETAHEKLEAAGIRLRSSHPVEDPDRLVETVRQAVADRAPMVIVGGGDGTLSSTVDELVGSDSVFALLPLGTANSFARTLGIPLDLDGAVRTIADGRVTRIDLGKIDGDYFANCAALGLSPMISEGIPPALKKYFGRLGYLAWAAWSLLRFHSFRLIVTDNDGGRHDVKALEVRIANGTFHGGVAVIGDGGVASGELVVQAVTGHYKRRLVLNWMRNLLGLHERDSTVREFRGRELRIETRPPLPVSIDGEVLARTPVTARVARGAIDVVVPHAEISPKG